MKGVLPVALILGLMLQIFVGLGVARAQVSKTVIIGMGQEPDRIAHSPMYVGNMVQNAIQDGLVEFDDRMQVFAELAEEIPTLENGGARFIGDGMDQALQVTFRLRQGVTWSDGTPFTSADVKATYDYVMNPLAGFDNSVESKIDRLDTPDAHTVVITFLSANAARQRDPDAYGSQMGPVIDPLYFFGVNRDDGEIYPAHVLQSIVDGDLRTSENVTAVDSSDYARNPVGTGPYLVESWDPGTQIVLRRRSDSFKGVPAIDTVVFRFIPAKDTLIAALEAGEVDMITSDSLDAGDSAVLDAIPGVTPHYIAGAVWEHLTLNLDNPILADKDVRQAMAYGLDRQELVDVILFGKSQVAHSQIPSWSWAYNPDVFKYDFNPQRAKALLELAGWFEAPDGIRVKDGQRLSLRYWSTGSALRPRNLTLVQDQLARIGIEMNIEFIPARVFFDNRASSPQALSARQFEVAEFAWVGGYDPGENLRFLNHSSNIPSAANNYRGGNFAGFRNFKNDLLLDQGLSVLDRQLRGWLYRDDQYILMEELPVIPLFVRPVITVASSKVLNYRPGGATQGETWNIHEWDVAP